MLAIWLATAALARSSSDLGRPRSANTLPLLLVYSGEPALISPCLPFGQPRLGAKPMTFWTSSGNRLRSPRDEETQMMPLAAPTITESVSYVWDTKSECSCRSGSRRTSELCRLGPTGDCPRPTRRPLSVEASPSVRSFDDRHQERRDQTRGIDERRWAAYARVCHERDPASLSIRLHGKPATQRNGRRDRQCGAPPAERRRDGRRQSAARERERRREQPDVVEVLQAAVRLAQRHHGFELLGDRRLGRVGEDPRLVHVEENGVVDPGGFRHDLGTDPDVHLQLEARPGQRALDRQTHSRVATIND